MRYAAINRHVKIIVGFYVRSIMSSLRHAFTHVRCSCRSTFLGARPGSSRGFSAFAMASKDARFTPEVVSQVKAIMNEASGTLGEWNRTMEILRRIAKPEDVLVHPKIGEVSASTRERSTKSGDTSEISTATAFEMPTAQGENLNVLASGGARIHWVLSAFISYT